MFSWTRTCSYDDEQKRRFHSKARTQLRKLAAELNLPPGSFDVRSNRAGIAVSGEITLHHEQIYIQVSQFSFSPGHGVLIRTCKGRKDFTGGPNHFLPLARLDDVPGLAAAVRAITGAAKERSRESTSRASVKYSAWARAF